MELGQYVMPDGVERVVRGLPARQIIPDLLDKFGYESPYIVASRTLNRKTEAVAEIKNALGSRVTGSTDDVGEHAPIDNILSAAQQISDAGADVILSIGGGSVLDFSKFVQLAISERAFTREALLAFQLRMSPDGTETVCTSTASPTIRQIAVPTTLAAAEWTPSGTPLDTVTGRKVHLRAVRGAPRAIVYDPEMLMHTPNRLLFASAIRGLDHSINSYLSIRPHPLVDLISLEAVRLYLANLPRLAENPCDRETLGACQLATWYTGMGNVTMSPLHGFSHYMVHILAPHIGAGHSETAGPLTLAQARWLEEQPTPRYEQLRWALPGQRRLSEALESLLGLLGLPTSLSELGATPEQVQEIVPLAMRHPSLARHSVRPLENERGLMRVVEMAW
jgi:maleylacetate reductase